MEFVSFEQAIKEAARPNWNGKTIWAKIGTAEMSIYKSIDMGTLKTIDQIRIDGVMYTETEYRAATRTFKTAGMKIIGGGCVKDNKGVPIFWNINAIS